MNNNKLIIDKDTDEAVAAMYKDGFYLKDIRCILEIDDVDVRKILRVKGLINSGKFDDITGQRFGKWTAVEYDGSFCGSSRWICRCDCGTLRSVKKFNLKHSMSISCGCLRAYSRSRDTTKHQAKKRSCKQYESIYFPEHPNSDKSGLVQEHVLIMGEYLGRPIRKGEIVHHKNGIKRDNRIENLELCTKVHPPSQRVDDLINFCVEFLQKYKPDLLS